MLRLILRMNRALSRVGPPFRRTGRFLRMGMMELGEGGEGGRDLVKEEGERRQSFIMVLKRYCAKPDSATNIVTIFLMYRSEVRGPNRNQFGSRAPAGV